MANGATPGEHLNPWMVLGVFAIGAVIVSLRTLSGAEPTLFPSADDAMRMVVVRDFLAGQGWYDLTQHRMNTPLGAEVHWSRLVDVPIAALVLLGRLFFGNGGEVFAGTVWPLTLLGVLLWLSAKLALRFVTSGRVLPALILPLLSPAITGEFAPGRIDHHGVQIILTLAIVYTAIVSLERARFAWLAGVLCATAIAIGIEALPTAVAAILVYGLIWVFDRSRARQVRGFGLAFAGASLVHLAMALPPGRWLEPACDMISAVYVTSAVLVGVVLTALTLVAMPDNRGARLGVGIVAGGLCLMAVALLFPNCLGGPYAGLDPWLRTTWIDAIAEARPWTTSLADLPAFTLAIGLPVVLGLAVIAYRVVTRAENRDSWLVLGAFLLVATLIMAVQVRGARLAIMPAIAAATWAIAEFEAGYRARRGVGSALGLVGSWGAFAGVLVMLAASGIVALVPGRAQTLAVARMDRAECLHPSAFADLAGLAPARIMTPIDLGAHMLLETGHAVVAAPYHRNSEGVRDAFDFFNMPIDAAREILTARDIGLVVTCPAMPEMAGLPDADPGSFVRRAKAWILPDWLEAISVGGPLKVYSVVPAR